jgi:hypothetical protein
MRESERAGERESERGESVVCTSILTRVRVSARLPNCVGLVYYTTKFTSLDYKVSRAFARLPNCILNPHPQTLNPTDP